MADSASVVAPIPVVTSGKYGYEDALIRIVWPDDHLDYDTVVVERHDATPKGNVVTVVSEIDIKGCTTSEMLGARLAASNKLAFTPANAATGPSDASSVDDFRAMRMSAGFEEYGPFRWFKPAVESGFWVWELRYGTAVTKYDSGLPVAGDHELNPEAAYATVYIATLVRGEERKTLQTRIYHSFDRDGGPLGFRNVTLPVTRAQMPRPTLFSIFFGDGWRSRSGANRSQAANSEGKVMGILSGIFKFFKSLFKSIFNFIKRNWLWIAIALVVVAVFFPMVLPAIWGALVSGWGVVASALTTVGSSYLALFTGLSFWEGVALAMGTAFVLAPEETAAVVTSAAGAVGTGVGALVGGVADASGLSGFGSTLAVAGCVGLGIYFLSKRNRDKKKEREVSGSEAATAEPGGAPA